MVKITRWEKFWENAEALFIALSFGIPPLIGAFIILIGIVYSSVMFIIFGLFTTFSPLIIIGAYELLHIRKERKSKRKM